MADPKAEEFDANERIAGFSMLGIKRAMQLIGIMDDRDDVDHVSTCLGCPSQQALRVLEELERRGLVAKGPKKKQWVTTPKGHRLALHWHPPRVLRPAIEYEAGPGSINEQFKAIPCSIWRYTPDEDEMFEEGEIDVGVHVDYDHDRLIEINLSQLDEYQGESNGAALCERSVYISPADAKTFIAGLQEAIERAEREAALRVMQKARRAKREEAKRLRRAKKSDERLAQLDDGDEEREPEPVAADGPMTRTAPTKRMVAAKRRPSVQRVEAPSPAPSPTPAQEPEAQQETRSGKAVAAALAELRETNRARLKAAAGRRRKNDE